jgi:hypothetical protein
VAPSPYRGLAIRRYGWPKDVSLSSLCRSRRWHAPPLKQPTFSWSTRIRSNANLRGNLALLNLASGQVVAHVPVGKEPHEVAVSADGRYAVVSNTGSYRQPGNSLLDISPDGTQVWVGCRGGNEIANVALLLGSRPRAPMKARHTRLRFCRSLRLRAKLQLSGVSSPKRCRTEYICPT